jgi:hypothetical protein
LKATGTFSFPNVRSSAEFGSMTEAHVLRVTVSSNITGTTLADYAFSRWVYPKEDAVARLFQSLLGMAREFDDGVVQFVSFQLPTAATRSVGPGADYDNLNVAVAMANDIIASVFYQIRADEPPAIEKQIPSIQGLAHRVLEAFSADHLEFYLSIRAQLDEAFQTNEPLEPDVIERFAAFVDKIPALVGA